MTVVRVDPARLVEHSRLLSDAAKSLDHADGRVRAAADALRGQPATGLGQGLGLAVSDTLVRATSAALHVSSQELERYGLTLQAQDATPSDVHCYDAPLPKWAGPPDGTEVAAARGARALKTALAEDAAPTTSQYRSPPGNWCAAFVTWVFAQAGLKFPPKTNTFPRGTNWNWVPNFAKEAQDRDHGFFVEVSPADVQPGDIVLYDYPGGADWDHMGIVKHRAADGTFESVDGNWDNTVASHPGSSMSPRRVMFVRPR